LARGGGFREHASATGVLRELQTLALLRNRTRVGSGCGKTRAAARLNTNKLGGTELQREKRENGAAATQTHGGALREVHRKGDPRRRLLRDEDTDRRKQDTARRRKNLGAREETTQDRRTLAPERKIRTGSGPRA
jgi:hypothetical protein